MKHLCWRHELRLMWAAFTSLLDPTGKQYTRSGARVLAKARECPRCQAKSSA